MGSKYKQLCLEERALIQTQISMGWSPAAIQAAEKLLEVERNANQEG